MLSVAVSPPPNKPQSPGRNHRRGVLTQQQDSVFSCKTRKNLAISKSITTHNQMHFVRSVGLIKAAEKKVSKSYKYYIYILPFVIIMYVFYCDVCR